MQVDGLSRFWVSSKSLIICFPNTLYLRDSLICRRWLGRTSAKAQHHLCNSWLRSRNMWGRKKRSFLKITKGAIFFHLVYSLFKQGSKHVKAITDQKTCKTILHAIYRNNANSHHSKHCVKRVTKWRLLDSATRHFCILNISCLLSHWPLLPSYLISVFFLIAHSFPLI